MHVVCPPAPTPLPTLVCLSYFSDSGGKKISVCIGIPLGCSKNIDPSHCHQESMIVGFEERRWNLHFN